MEPFTKLTGVVAPMDRVNVDTDQIIPARFLKSIERTGYGDSLFTPWRSPKPARRERYDYEDQRNGTRNLHAVRAPGRHVAVTERRPWWTSLQMRWLADEAPSVREDPGGAGSDTPPSYETFGPRRLGEYANAWNYTRTSWRQRSLSWPGESSDEETLSGARPWRQNETKPEQPLTGDSPLWTSSFTIQLG